MQVHTVMTGEPVTILPTATLAEAMEVLESTSIRHLPVVNPQRELLGMVSDRDLRNATVPLHRASDDVKAGAILARQVSELMSSDVLTVHEDDPLFDAVDLMLTHGVGAIPVTNADGELVGIVSYVDVLRNVQDLL